MDHHPNQATGHPHCDPDDIDGSDLADGGEPGDHYYGGMLWRAKNQRHGAKWGRWQGGWSLIRTQNDWDPWLMMFDDVLIPWIRNNPTPQSWAQKSSWKQRKFRPFFWSCHVAIDISDCQLQRYQTYQRCQNWDFLKLGGAPSSLDGL